MNSGAKNKIISILIATSIIAANFIFPSSAKAAVSANSLIDMTNSARQSIGLKPYEVNSVLTSSAYAKAQDIIKYDYFAHYSPQGKSPWIFIKNAGYSYFHAGENLAINFNAAQDVHNAWMSSPTHKSNILDKDFTEIGMAVLVGNYQGKNTTIIVQHFGSPVTKSALIVKPAKNINKVKTKPNMNNFKINLDIKTIETPNVVTKPTNNLVWFSSPALFVIKTIS